MNHKSWSLLALASFGALLSCESVLADTWKLPTDEVTESASGRVRVTVMPRYIESPLAFFKDKEAGQELAGQKPGETRSMPMARIERMDAAGAWTTVWERPLVNDVGPNSALVTDDASYVVTFDNWHAAGYGDDVVVIYDGQGELVRKMSLEQILPPAYVNNLPRSASSRWWGGEHALVDGEAAVELHVVKLPVDFEDEDLEFAPVRIRLADGAVLPYDGPEWADAIAKATAIEDRRLKAWRELRARRALPLSKPTSSDTRAWRDYMFELRDRIAGEDERMGGMLVAAPGEKRGYHDLNSIRSWIARYDGSKSYESKSFIVASPTSDLLASVLVEGLSARPAGSMDSAHIVFVGTPEEGARVSAAASGAGARITVVDVGTAYSPGAPLPDYPPPWWMADDDF